MILKTDILFFSFAFIFFTIIGTLSHELGHYIVSKHLGYKSIFHYKNVEIVENEDLVKLQEIFVKYKYEIKNKFPFDKEKEYFELWKKLDNESLWFLLGGVLQTIITGTLGLIFIIFRRQNNNLNQLTFVDWIAVFLALFWLREVFNLTISVIKSSFIGSLSFGGDESIISEKLGFHESVIPVFLGSIGLIISLYITFKIVPFKKRKAFILGGLIGGFSGYMLWMKIIGPIVLP